MKFYQDQIKRGQIYEFVGNGQGTQYKIVERINREFYKICNVATDWSGQEFRRHLINPTYYKLIS